MPQIIIEYSEDLKFQVFEETILNTLKNTLSDTPWIDLETVKARLVPIRHYFVGSEANKKFIHIEVKLFRKDRTAEMMQNLLENFFEYFKIAIEPNEQVELTGEISFLEHPYYYHQSISNE